MYLDDVVRLNLLEVAFCFLTFLDSTIDHPSPSVLELEGASITVVVDAGGTWWSTLSRVSIVVAAGIIEAW